MLSPVLVWFRKDLRLNDNPTLHEAIRRGRPIVPVFVWCPEEEGTWAPASASKWWLHQSLRALSSQLQALGSQLVVRIGPTEAALSQLVRQTGATTILWSRRYEPHVARRDRQLTTALEAQGLEVQTFNASLLYEPWEVQSGEGKAYQVYSPFYRATQKLPPPGPTLPTPTALPGPDQWPESVLLEQLALEPTIDWAGGMRDHWTPGAVGAASRLEHFLATALAGYDEERNRPDRVGTSSLSPHLHFGEIGPRQIWHAVQARHAGKKLPAGPETFVKEIFWREFAHHVLHHFPHTPAAPLRPEFARFPWKNNEKHLRAWQRGQTGYPIVDAGMRQLWAIGWMHNRVRMIVASFLVKDLLISWQEGARWFWDTLVDADLANNTLGWQWTAGCGADAAPYFRVFNPMSQGERFDPQGDYVRHWVPELAKLPTPWIHQPWQASASVLSDAGVSLGTTYPRPLVDHDKARLTALDALAKIKSSS